jgi:hypothetical protein
LPGRRRRLIQQSGDPNRPADGQYSPVNPGDGTVDSGTGSGGLAGRAAGMAITWLGKVDKGRPGKACPRRGVDLLVTYESPSSRQSREPH